MTNTKNLPERIELDPADRYIPLLNHGYVRYVDHMGSDKRVVDSARRSYQEGTRPLNDDRVLLRYLYRHKHTSPFEQCEIALDVKMPIFIARQLFRHRTASVNELSGRYSIMPEEVYVPELDRIQVQSQDSKQGSGDALESEAQIKAHEILVKGSKQDFADYHELLELGLSRELARTKTPVSTFTNFDWKQDLRNLLHMTRLRIDPHAQYEIRVYAQAIADIIAKLYPYTWEAFVDYELEAENFTRLDLLIMKKMFEGQSFTSDQIGEWAEEAGMNNKRELAELVTKLAFLGVQVK